MSKLLMACAALKLVEQGKLDLDRSLAEYLDQPYLPDKPRHRRITARRVLSHTTGFPDWRTTGWPKGGPLPLLYDPGTRFTHSGEGFLYLQRVVEHITDTPIQSYLQTTLLRPFWWILITLAMPAVSEHAMAAEARKAVASAAAAITSVVATGDARVVRFPAERSVGTLVDLDRPRDENGHLPDWWMWNGFAKSPAHEIADARGDVLVHPGQRLGLIVTPHGPDDDLRALRSLPSGSVELLAFNTKGPPPGDACVASICAIPGLRTLLLEKSNISNEGLSRLTNAASLERLMIVDEDLNATGVCHIAKIKSLKGLRIHRKTITAENLSDLSQLDSLEELIIGGVLEGEGLSHLNRLPALWRLHIGAAECCASGLQHLAALPALTCLSFDDLNPKGLAALPPMPKLKELGIQYKGGTFQPEHLASLAGFPQLETLRLTGCYTDDGLVHLKSLKQLKNFSLHGNWQDADYITDATFAHVSTLERLETVQLYTGAFTDDGLRYLAALPRIRKIDIPNPGGRFTDAALESLARSKTLEELRLRGDRITDAGLRHLEASTSFRSLRLFPRSQVTEEGIARLKRLRPTITDVESNSSGVSRLP